MCPCLEQARRTAWTIMSIGLRDWAHGVGSAGLGISCSPEWPTRRGGNLWQAGGVRRWRGRLRHGATEPAYQLDPGRLKHPRLRQGPRGPGARRLDFASGASCAGGEEGGNDGGSPPALRGARRAQGLRGGGGAAGRTERACGARCAASRPPRRGCWRSAHGWPNAAAPMPRWRRPGCTGSRSGTCCRTAISR